MAMYEENARKIGGILAAINPDLVPDIISLGHIDAMLNIAERLDQGAFVGVLARSHAGEEPVQAVTLLGQRAYLPTGADARGGHVALPGVFHGRLVSRQK